MDKDKKDLKKDGLIVLKFLANDLVDEEFEESFDLMSEYRVEHYLRKIANYQKKYKKPLKKKNNGEMGLS
jgi:hypothetical protein